MRTLPALRHSYASGILRALNERGPLSLADLIESVPKEDLFKGNTTNFESRARSLLIYERELGLVASENGAFSLTAAGSQYVAAGDPEDFWTVTEEQAALLRDLMVRRHSDGAIFQSAALALSVLASGKGTTPSHEELGRAFAAADGTTKWKESKTFDSQARGYTTLLTQMGLIDANEQVTPAGRLLLEEIEVLAHPPLEELIVRRESVRDVAVWLVRGGDRGQAEGINFGENVVSIGWSELPDLAEMATIEEVRELYAQTYPEATQATVNTQARQVFLFAQKIAEGDLVLSPLKTQPGFIAVARVTGPYEYRDREPFVPEAQHTHPVQWLSQALPSEALAEDLRARLGFQQTVSKLDVPDAGRLVTEALSGGDETLHLVVKWSAAYGPETVERHVDVAREHGAVWWGLATRGGAAESWVDQRWIDRLRNQIAGGVRTNVFIAGPTCWKTNLLAVSYSRDEVDEQLIPPYYREVERRYHLWVKLSDFEPTDRDSLLRLLDAERKSSRGKLVALGNQTNPLFVRVRTTPRHWWVNQGASYVRAREGGYIWAPTTDKAGNTPEHWRTMRYLREGDIVFNYANTRVRSLSEVVTEAAPTSRPDPEADHAWGDEGLRAELRYNDLPQSVVLSEIPIEWRRSEGGPFTKDGGVKQGYLFPLSDEFVRNMVTQFPQLALQRHQGAVTVEAAYEEPPFDAIETTIAAAGITIDARTLRRYHVSLKTRGFVVLSGVSGTGKTWLAEAYAHAVKARALIVPVAPNWTTNEDLLGYLNPLDNTYHDTEFSVFLRAAAEEFTRAKQASQRPRPYHLILDEMNLARVEYYFAKFLSAMELRARSENAFIELAPNHRIALTPNLKFIGTVNVDETTHGFADKVYDRSQLLELTIDRDAVVLHLADRPFAAALTDVWSIMREVAPFAFRVLDEIAAYVDEAEGLGVPWEVAFDEQLLQKVLPKIKGTDLRVGSALQAFIELSADRFPLSHYKASTMLRAFTEHGFTSYF